MRGHLLAPLLLVATASGAQSLVDRPGDPAAELAGADAIAAQVAAMGRSMKPGQGFLAQPVVRDGATVAALEYWRKPGRPAVHPADAEYAIVIAGAGTLVSGGKLVAPEVRSAGLTEGTRIDGGTSRPLRPGDVLLVPAGVPHWFGIDGDRLVLLGIKLTPRP